MKKNLVLLIVIVIFALVFTTACSKEDDFINPGDSLGGGGEGYTSVQSLTDLSSEVELLTSNIDEDLINKYSEKTDSSSATLITDTSVLIETAGEYILEGEYSNVVVSVGKGEVVHLFLNNATISSTNAIGIFNENKKSTLIITAVEGTTNSISTTLDDTNAIHVKGNLIINGSGTINVTSSTKSSIKVSKDLYILDATLNLNFANYGINARNVIANGASVNANASSEESKDGIRAECDEDDVLDAINSGETGFLSNEGYVYMVNTNYVADVYGDGIQADTFIYMNKSTCDITTNSQFVAYTTENMETYELTEDDFRWEKVGSSYSKVASDEIRNMSGYYALAQSCKGLKVGEISYTDTNNEEQDVVDGNYNIIINSSVLNINTTDDAIHVNSGNVFINGGEFTIETKDDGITADDYVQIKDCSVTISSCYEGIEGAKIEIVGENTVISIVSSDDGINAASDTLDKQDIYIYIENGKISINASGDGIDSNGSVLITGGALYIDGPTSGGDSSLDSETGILVNGGYLFAAGSLGMVETPASNSSQYIVSLAVKSQIQSGTKISVLDEEGNEIMSYTLEKTAQSIIISCPEFEEGKTYTIQGDSTTLSSFTISSTITTIGSSTTIGGEPQGGRRR